jgi:hypothetical protein
VFAGIAVSAAAILVTLRISHIVAPKLSPSISSKLLA